MKICPKCQQQFPNGFQYCPNDTEYLIANEEYARRTRPTPSAPIIDPVERPPANPIPPRNAEPFRSRQTGSLRPEPPRSEPVRPPQNTPRSDTAPIAQPPAGYGGNRAPQVPQQPSRPWPQAQPPIQSTPAAPNRPIAQPPQSRPAQSPPPQSRQAQSPPPQSRQVAPSAPAGAVSQTPNFGFSIPESPSLISRLIGGFKSIGDSFKFAPARTGATGDFQFLLKDESLSKRITREIVNALNEFRRNPRVFISEFVRGEGTNRFRRNAMLAGSELALTGIFTIYFFSQALAGLSRANPLPINLFHAGFGAFLLTCFLVRVFLLYRLVYRATGKFAAPKVALEFVNWTPLVAILLLAIFLNNYGFYCRIFPSRCVAPKEKLDITIVELPTTDVDVAKLEVKADKKPVKERELGGSKPKPQKAAGGGGGGRQRPEPPSKGVPPQMALTPQIVLPNPEPPKIKNPTLPVAMTTYGDPSLRMPKGPIGDPTGVPAPPSPGPGTGGGIGRSSGTGVGGGTGGGAGPGRGGNTGGGDMNIGGGRSVEPMTASLRPTILYREKAKYTEEARQNKIQGSVVLQVVFNVNGSITDIRVIRGLPDGLTEKAIEAAKKIRFNPAVKNGVPVSVRGTLDFTFNLY
jgi:TonB family protein